MAVKEPNKWRTNPNAFPKRVLRLNLLSGDVPDEDGILYDFRFLDDSRAANSDTELWFKVPDIVGMASGPAMLKWLVDQGMTENKLTKAYTVLDRLHRTVHTDQLLFYYEEEAQELERVLNIFIRLNSGGTVLSYSDLLLSIAVAQWSKIDARSEIHALVDELNKIGTGFNLSQDFVLKAGLMLTDIASVGFKVENFNRANMEKLEVNWPAVRRALLQTVEQAASFGLNGQTLRADSALLPIAYYLLQKKAPDNYVTQSQYQADRQAIRGWLIRSLLKASGIWGSGLDTLLTALRKTIQTEGAAAFPVSAIRQVMATGGKSLTFEPEEIEELVSMQYGDKRLFALLSLLFPFVDLRNQFHIDHVFPASRFTALRLSKAGVPNLKIENFIQLANTLGNLQLLEGTMNVEKRAVLLEQRGMRSKQRILISGRAQGGGSFGRGALYHLLQNRIYRGEAVHKGVAYPGEHKAIVDEELWRAVQDRLAANRTIRRKSRIETGALLGGLIYDDRGNIMSPTYSIRRGNRYRYYISSALLHDRRPDAGSLARINADDVERLVVAVLGRELSRPELLADGPSAGWSAETRTLVRDTVERVVIQSGQVQITRRPAATSAAGDPPPTKTATRGRSM